jgi:hypothetical protein
MSMKIVSLVVVALMLLAGCGPSAQEQRACEMYVEAGGGLDRGLAYWQKSTRANADSLLRRFPNIKITVAENYALADAHAARMAEQMRVKNQAANAVVSVRLTMSGQEVERALTHCPAANKEE